MDKSHVSMEQRMCLVCCETFDTGNILMDTSLDPVTRELRKSLAPKTCVEWGLCPEHRRMYDDGYVALVGVDPTKSGPVQSSGGDPMMMASSAHRTGRIAHLRMSVFDKVFGVPIPLDNGKPAPIAFVEDAVIDILGRRMTVRQPEGSNDAAS